MKIKITQIDNFENYPFFVKDDDTLKELFRGIKESGLLNPIRVRPKQNNRYELILGHRRKLATQLNVVDEIDTVVKELDDDEATIYMVDSNIYREKILPSEKAFAYKMKMDAMKHLGEKFETCATGLHKSRDKVANGESGEMVRRFIRLSNLIPDLLKLVDNSILHDKRTYLTIGIKPVVGLLYLTEDEQNLIYSTFIYEDLTPSHGQSIKIRRLSKNKKLNYDTLMKILSETNGNQNEQISFNKEKIESALPTDLLKRDKRYIKQFIIEAILKYKEIKKEELEKNRYK